MVVAVKDIVTVVAGSNVEDEFQDLQSRAPSLPGLIQRLEEIISLQLETRHYKDVEEFDYIGGSLTTWLTQERNCGMPPVCFESERKQDMTWTSRWDNVPPIKTC